MRVIRAFVILVLLLVVAVFAWGLFAGGSLRRADGPVDRSPIVNVDAARERGAELGEKAAQATVKLQETIDEAGITGKIKAKLALDDYVKARNINVTTNGTVVTLTGEVKSAAEQRRAVNIASETAGVSRVVDHLEIH